MYLCLNTLWVVRAVSIQSFNTFRGKCVVECQWNKFNCKWKLRLENTPTQTIGETLSSCTILRWIWSSRQSQCSLSRPRLCSPGVSRLESYTFALSKILLQVLSKIWCFRRYGCQSVVNTLTRHRRTPTICRSATRQGFSLYHQSIFWNISESKKPGVRAEVLKYRRYISDSFFEAFPLFVSSVRIANVFFHRLHADISSFAFGK